MGTPPRSGKLKNSDLFDASFFGINEKQANTTDPQFRILLETAYEAIVDAGNEKIPNNLMHLFLSLAFHQKQVPQIYLSITTYLK